jgi:quercetin dioxygenase-like cupin family protein
MGWCNLRTVTRGVLLKKAIQYLLLPATIFALSISCASAQQRQGIKSVQLMTKPVTGVPDKEMLILAIDLAPGGASGIHTHPGDEAGTVIEGTLMVKVGDEDYKPVAMGQTFSAPPNTPMGIMNTSDKPTKVIGVLIVEKGKPYSTPVK